MLRIISKEIVSSHNIRFTGDTDKDVDGITELIVNFYLNKEQDDAFYTLHIENPYSNLSMEIQLSIYSFESTKKKIDSKETTKNTFAIYDPYHKLLKQKVLSIFPYNIAPSKDRDWLFNTFKTYIQHEIAHAIDPKIEMSRNSFEGGTQEYYSSPVEFDGYSKQITEYLRSQINQNPFIRKTIIKWLRDSHLIPENPLYDFSKAINAWTQSDIENDTGLINRFKHRLYNDLYNELFPKENNK